MYRMQNRVVYGPLSKITKLASMPAVENNTKESKLESGVKEGSNQAIRKSVKKQLSAIAAPTEQSTTTQATALSDTMTEPMNQQGSQEEKDYLQSQLREAILLSEILGKPVCRKRKRSYYGN